MSKLYFSVRWWRHYRGSFPFDRFADVPDEAMREELEKFAAELALAHKARVLAARQKHVETLSKRGSRARARRSIEEQPPNWSEMMSVMSWWQPHNLIMTGPGGEDLDLVPTPWLAFYAIADRPEADSVLEVVKRTASPRNGVYTWRAERKDSLRTVEWLLREKSVTAIRDAALKPRPFKSQEDKVGLITGYSTSHGVFDWLQGLYREAQSAEGQLAAALLADHAAASSADGARVLESSVPRDDPQPEAEVHVLDEIPESREADTKSIQPRAKSKRGVASDTKLDARIAAAWKTGRYASKADLATAFELGLGEVNRALDRERKRVPSEVKRADATRKKPRKMP